MPSNCAKQPGGRANDKHPRGFSIVQLPATVCAMCIASETAVKDFRSNGSKFKTSSSLH